MLVAIREKIVGKDLPIIYKWEEEKITESQLSEIEKYYNFSLPEDYRNFILKNNGGQPFPQRFRTPNSKRWCEVDADCFDSISYKRFKEIPDEYFSFATPPNQKKINMITIASDGQGDCIALKVRGLNKGKIYYFLYMQSDVDENGGLIKPKFDFLANNFTEFISNYIYHPNMKFEELLIRKDLKNLLLMINSECFDPNAPLIIGDLKLSYLELSREHKNIEVFKALINKGAIPNQTNLLICIRNTNQDEYLDFIREIIKFEVNINQLIYQDKNHNISLLMETLKLGNYETAELLIEHGADINYRDEKGKTALDSAIESKSYWVDKLSSTKMEKLEKLLLN
jgi:hypothetical protein